MPLISSWSLKSNNNGDITALLTIPFKGTGRGGPVRTVVLWDADVATCTQALGPAEVTQGPGYASWQFPSGTDFEIEIGLRRTGEGRPWLTSVVIPCENPDDAGVVTLTCDWQ